MNQIVCTSPHLLPPFSVNEQLYDGLLLASDTRCASKDPNKKPCVPGYPLLDISDSNEVLNLISRDLTTPRLDDLHRYFSLISTPSGSHISALHAQIVRGRTVIIAEDPDLHLVWHFNRIFIKPLPVYLLNYALWGQYLSSTDTETQALRQVAAGLVRSYAYLVQRRSDYDLALELKLIRGLEATDEDFERFLRFVQRFKLAFCDKDLNPRYHYGELRLTRLNLWTRLTGRGLEHTRSHGQYGPFLAHFVAPFLFVFGTLTLALTAMQVVVGVLQVHESGALYSIPSWSGFLEVCVWYSMACTIIVVAALVFFPLVIIILLVREGIFAFRAIKKQTEPR